MNIGGRIITGEVIIPFEEIINTSRASICTVESLKLGAWVRIAHGLKGLDTDKLLKIRVV